MTALQDTAPQASPKSRAETVQRVVTPLGLEAWLVEDYAVPLVAFDFAFKGGASQDPAGKAGVAHMLSALLDEGAGPYDSDAFHRALDDRAVELSFHAGHDNFQGELKTLSKHVDEAFELMRVAVCEPRLETDAIERVRGQIVAGLKHEAKDPNTLSGRAFRKAAFGDHPYGRSSQGDLESIPRIVREDLTAFHRNALTRGNLKIAAVGAIDAARLASLIDKAFSALPAAPNLVAIPDVTPATDGARTIIDVDVPQTTIRFGLPGVPRHDPDYVTGVVLNHILGGGSFSARLFKEVREKRGLAYSVHSQLSNHDHAALFTGGTSTKNERAAESLSVIQEEIEKLRSDGPTETELEKAKKYLIGSYALRFDTSTKIAGNLVAMQTDGYPVDYLDRRNGLIAAVTMEDIKRVADRLFAGKTLLVAAAGRPEGM
ncbi:MAG: peptidase domain protein [Hyphomicrobiales bacterium]|nr:peptidase domain protein [Hyphomicrobiales bacterium]